MLLTDLVCFWNCHYCLTFELASLLLTLYFLLPLFISRYDSIIDIDLRMHEREILLTRDECHNNIR